MSLDYGLSLQTAVKAHFWFLVSNIFLTSLSEICLLLQLLHLKNTIFLFSLRRILSVWFVLCDAKDELWFTKLRCKGYILLPSFYWLFVGTIFFLYIKTRHRWNCFLDNSIYRFIIGLYSEALYFTCTLVCTSLLFILFCVFGLPLSLCLYYSTVF